MTCQVCGCTNDEPCVDEDFEITCGWAEANLCTFCAEKADERETSFPNLEQAGFVLP